MATVLTDFGDLASNFDELFEPDVEPLDLTAGSGVVNRSTARHPRSGVATRCKIGGLTVSLAALVAACGDDRTGDEAPGRVGYAPPITDPPDYPIDDAVLLRTASSLELTLVDVYETILGVGVLDGDQVLLVGTLGRRPSGRRRRDGRTHRRRRWHRLGVHQPVEHEPIGRPDARCDPGQRRPDARHPQHRQRPGEPRRRDPSVPHGRAHRRGRVGCDHGCRDARVAPFRGDRRGSRGAEGYVSPTLGGGDVASDAEGIPLQFAITDRFGSIGQIELIVGAPDENGVRETFILQTPSLNSLIYNELEPTC